MDIFSHGLWATAVSKEVSLRTKKIRINPWFAAWCGVFPDLFAFTIPFVALIIGRLTGNDTSAFPRPEDVEPLGTSTNPMLDLAHHLYNISHSLVIFTLVIALVIGYRALKNRHTLLAAIVPWSMGGWLLHIFADIPTHTYRFFPTPVLWPIADWKFNGFSWGQWWFILANYSLLALFTLSIWWRKRNLKRTENHESRI